MVDHAPHPANGPDEGEARALAAAVAQAEEDARRVPRHEMRAELLRLASSKASALPPVPRLPIA